MEIPKMTPGITSGASIMIDRNCLPRNRPRSIRNALVVPTIADSAVTHRATMQLVHMLPSNSLSAKSPMRPDAGLPRNQSRVKPRQGGAG